MDEVKVEINQFKDKKGKTKYSCVAYGHYGEFDTQIEAASFADACADIWRRKNGN